MINDVRNTVLSILSKDNNGYITPEQFNLYAKQAQTEIFEQYAYDYSSAINKRNAHLHTSGLGDMPKRIAEVIGRFNYSDILTVDGVTLRFNLPTDAYSLGVISTDKGYEIEMMAQNKILRLLKSLDTAPTLEYPAYVIINDPSITGNSTSGAGFPNNTNQIQVYPITIATYGEILINYIRYPKTPKWTYSGLLAGEPIFNQSAGDYQDFELPQDDEMNLIVKILEYSGAQIRDRDIAQMAKTEEIQEKTEQRQ